MSTLTYGQFRCNNYTSDDQFDPQIIALSDGGYLVCWTSVDQYSSADIFAQRYDANGTRVGSETRINTSITGNDQAEPSMTLLSDGSYVIAWHDAASGNAFFQHFSSTGSKIGGEVRMNTGSEAEDPIITALAGGGFVATWQRENLSTGYDLYQQRFDASGNKLGSETRINTTTSSDQESQQVIGLSGGGYVVIWESLNQDGSGLGLYSQRFSAGGVKLGGETLVTTTTADDQHDVAVAALKNGGYVVTWESSSGGIDDVFMQRYDANGNKLGGETPVNSTTTDDQDDPSIAVLGNGDYVITWTSDGQDGSGDGIYMQRFDASGNALGSETQVNTTVTGDQQDSSVIALADGGFLVSWTQSVSGGQMDVYSQRYDADGNKLSGLNGDGTSNILTWSGSNSVIIKGYDGDDQLTGNSANDQLSGGSGNDRLNGRGGDDRMTGGSGNDRYIVDSRRDLTIETSSDPTQIDTVQSYVSWMLGDNIERLILSGSSAINGSGNSLDNRLYGNSAHNRLTGGAGYDTMSGGGGSDDFVLNSRIGYDRITDFLSGTDNLVLDNSSLGGLGDKDGVLEGAVLRANSGGFSKSAELVVISSNIVGAITNASAAAKIGSATSAYTVGDARIFAVDNGSQTSVYLFKAADADAAVESHELRLLGILSNTQTGLGDYLFQA